MLCLSGFGLVLYIRFTEDTTSYTARESLYSTAFSEIPSHFLTGGVDTLGASSHNYVLDSLLRAASRRDPRRSGVPVDPADLAGPARANAPCTDWLVPVAAAFALPLVRLATSGGGLINPVEWVTLGFITGALAAYRILESRRAGASSPGEAQPSRAGEPTARMSPQRTRLSVGERSSGLPAPMESR